DTERDSTQAPGRTSFLPPPGIADLRCSDPTSIPPKALPQTRPARTSTTDIRLRPRYSEAVPPCTEVTRTGMCNASTSGKSNRLPCTKAEEKTVPPSKHQLNSTDHPALHAVPAPAAKRCTRPRAARSPVRQLRVSIGDPAPTGRSPAMSRSRY